MPGTASIKVLALPGGLDDSPMLVSNHPELVRGPGIAVSTLSWPGEAHLDLALSGDISLFAHHQNRARRALRQVVVASNPGSERAEVIVTGATCFTTREAPYRDRPGGPGAAVADALLQAAPGRAAAVIGPGGLAVLHERVVAHGDEITTQLALNASALVCVVVAFLDDATPDLQAVLQQGSRLPADPAAPLPTMPEAPGSLIYGRAAGVQAGSRWRGTIPLDGRPACYLLVGKAGRTEGTGQDQAAPMLRRYPDAAYAAHGNYGVLYDLRVLLPAAPGRLFFDTPPDPALPADPPLLALRRRVGLAPPRLAFRGTLELTPPGGEPSHIYVSQGFGERGRRPLCETPPGPGELRLRFYYPANATPPHLLRFESR